MDGQLAARWWLTLTGAVGAVLLWAVAEASDKALIGDRAALVLVTLLGTHFLATLAMAGPIGLARALPRAGALAAVTAGLVWLAGLRHASANDFLDSPLLALAALTVASLPVPFLIASCRGGWRDYGALFLEAWSIVVRYAAAWTFVGLVWLVIFLSDQVMQMVGVTLISELLDHSLVPILITGAVLGLGMAVVHELADMLSPYLVLRLFRLILPVVLAVMVVFLVALPFRGLEGVFNELSPTMLLLTMVAAGLSLVSITIDQTDAEAAQSPALRRAAQGMALILPVMAGIAAWSIWLRVDQHGWTPERLFVAVVAGLGLAYGGAYALSVLRGRGWMERIRQANIRLALLVVLLAGLWLTPVLNAERISASSQLARYVAGQTRVEDLDIRAYGKWGLPGEELLARLKDLSTQPGHEALAARLSGKTELPPYDHASAVAALVAVLPIQPAGATGTRDVLLDAAADYMVTDWTEACENRVEGDNPTCLMVVADLLPTVPGEEAMLFLERSADYVEVLGLYIGPDGVLVTRPAVQPDGLYPTGDAAVAFLRQWSQSPPPLTPALLNQLGTGDAGLFFLP